MKKLPYALIFTLFGTACWSDRIGNYHQISQSIPKMEMKADPQSQAWARSARHVLTITNESIAETLIAMNNQAANQGHPFFCLPKNKPLNAELMRQLIEASKEAHTGANNTTVSQVALTAVMQKFPCQSKRTQPFSSLSETQAAMAHAEQDG